MKALLSVQLLLLIEYYWYKAVQYISTDTCYVTIRETLCFMH